MSVPHDHDSSGFSSPSRKNPTCITNYHHYVLLVDAPLSQYAIRTPCGEDEGRILK